MQAGAVIVAARPSMEETLLAMDWTATALGPPAQWPLALTSIASLILASGKPMFVVWGEQRTLIYNDAYVPLLGGKHPAALGRPYFVVWPDAAADVAALFDRLFGNAAVDLDDISISFDREDASPGGVFAASYTPIRDQSHRVVGVLCIHSETTKSIAAPAAVAAPHDHQRLAKLFEQAPSLIAILSGATHRVELANAEFLQLVNAGELIGQPLAAAIPDAVAPGYLHTLDQAFARGEVLVSRGTRFVGRAADPPAATDPAAGAPAARAPATGDRYIDFVLQPITDAIGQVTGIFVHGSDVTERTRLDRVLRERELHLTEENADLGRQVTARSAELLAKEALISAVYENSSECHIVVRDLGSGRFRVEEMNPAALALHGVMRSQIIGRSVDDLLAPPQAQSLNARLAHCLDDPRPTHCEWLHGGSIIEGIASPLPAYSAGGRQIAISARNVTEKRALEEQLRQSQKMEAVGQLTGGLAHDFNNLLTGIMGALEILDRRLAQGQAVDARRYIGVAQGAAQRAAALTQRLLAFARRQALDARSTAVNRLVEDMRELIERTMGPSIRVRIDAAVDLWQACVDPNQLENALLNLCLNARDAMPAGGSLGIEARNRHLDAETAAEHEMPAGNYVVLSVSDSGTGMPPEVMAKVFEPFFTTKPVGAGTGLGLSMVYGFTRQSGGHVWIESSVGIGTTVRILLPRHAGEQLDTAPVVAPPLPRRAGAGDTILVVDDEAMIRLWVTEVLNDLGYVTLETQNAEEALQLIESGRRIDLVITDIGLPGGIDGRELAAAARALREQLPILLMTGYGEDVAGQFSPARPGEEMLRKPFAMQELALRVSTLLGK
jgi:PAS domain S-box-containing protein